MKFLNSLLLSAVCSLWLSFHALAHTHFTPPLQPELVASEKASYLIAKTWFLPDYQGDTSSRSETNNNPGGGDIKGECGTYGLIAACASPKTPIGAKRPRADLVCYERCVCPSSYRYNSSNCNSAGYNLGGGSCDGLYYSCSPKACPSGSATYCSSNQVATFNGYYSGSSRCYTCRNKDDTCPSGYSKSVCTSSQVQTNTSRTEAGSTCYACRNKDDNCPGGYSKSRCGSNQVQTNTARTEAGTTCYSCRAATCADGNYKSSVPSGQVCTAVSYAGLTCYTGCRDKTCEEKGQKTCNGSCIATSACCGGCQTGYECQNGTCKPLCRVGFIYYSDGTCTENVQTGKSATGVVASFDGSKGFLISLNEANKPWGLNGSDASSCTNSSDRDSVHSCLVGRGSDAERYCGSQGNGWFMATKTEWSVINGNCAAINSGLSNLGHVVLGDRSYWTQTQYDNYNAWHSNPIRNNIRPTTGINGKNQNYSVRCIKSFCLSGTSGCN